MRKAALFTAAAVLAAMGIIVTMKVVPATSAATAQAPVRIARADMPAQMPIVPSPVIDTSAPVFIGSGDGSGGAWVSP